MPRPTTTPDRLDLATGETIRTCTRCGFEGVLTHANFYHRANGWTDRRCQTCRRAVDAANRIARREGRGVRSTPARKFGVEIEFVGAQYEDVIREMEARGVRVYFAGYTHRVDAASWKIVRDGSVPLGWELVSPPLSGRDGLAQLRQACAALAAAGARVDRRCGLHVHHDVGDLSGADFRRLLHGWSRNQRATNGLVAPSRRNSQWAGPLTREDLSRADSLPADAVGVDGLRGFFGGYRDEYRRYRSLNVESFPRYGTVEIRQHQGSMNYEKIAAWVAFGQAFIAAAKAGDVEAAQDAPGLVEVLSRTGRLPAAHAAVLRTRAAHFAGSPVAA
jgi:hypothetical protein